MRRGGASIIAAALVLSACSSATGTIIRYPAYTYGCCVEITSVTIWHAGDHVTLHWTSRPISTTDSTPYSVTLRLTLTGPFSTVDQLKSAMSKSSKPAGVRTVEAPALDVTDFTGGSPASELALPADLPPGYYNLDALTATGGSSEGGGAIIQISP